MECNSKHENDYNLCELAEQVKSKDDFIRYVKLLSEDFEKHPDEWQNITIPDFLECMAAWVYDYSNCPRNDIDWDAVHYSELAQILYMGKIYE